MKGNTLNEFIDSLYINCDKELIYKGRKIMVEGWFNPKDSTYTLRAFECCEDYPELFLRTDSDRTACVTAFEEAKIFNGLTIFEAENEIEVLYG